VRNHFVGGSALEMCCGCQVFRSVLNPQYYQIGPAFGRSRKYAFTGISILHHCGWMARSLGITRYDIFETLGQIKNHDFTHLGTSPRLRHLEQNQPCVVFLG